MTNNAKSYIDIMRLYSKTLASLMCVSRRTKKFIVEIETLPVSDYHIKFSLSGNPDEATDITDLFDKMTGHRCRSTVAIMDFPMDELTEKVCEMVEGALSWLEVFGFVHESFNPSDVYEVRQVYGETIRS